MSSIISLTVKPDVECLLIAGSSQENFSGRLYMGHARNLILTLWENQRLFKQSSIKNVFIMPKKTPNHTTMNKRKSTSNVSSPPTTPFLTGVISQGKQIGNYKTQWIDHRRPVQKSALPNWNFRLLAFISQN